MRSAKTIAAAEGELLDKIWYNRHLVFKYNVENGIETCDPKIWKGALASAEKMRQKYGGEKIILSADVLDSEVRINGWQSDSGMKINTLIEKFLGDGLQRVCVTSIKCDGMLSGPDIDLYKKLQMEFPQIRFTASGGVSSEEDLIKLNEIDIDSVIVGKAIYENRISLARLAEITSE